MIRLVRNYWNRLRARRHLSLAVDVTLIVLVMLAVHAWNTRNLSEGLAPSLGLPTLDGTPAKTRDGTGVVYFFAPWCFYCRHSIGNVEGLVTSGDLDWAIAVALDYRSPGAVRQFVTETGFSQTVLLGEVSTGAEWGIRAYPTYFVIGPDGHIKSRSVGYSTLPGLWVRSRMAR